PSNPNIIYAGTGVNTVYGDVTYGNGMYKSTNGGERWQHLGLQDTQHIARILVDPRNPDIVLVAAIGHPYGPNEERGVFRSTDGGKTFRKVLYKDENTGAIDVAFDPTNAQTVYAALWAARQGPWEYNNAYTGPTSGLFKSTDGGDSSQAVTSGLPGAADGLGRVGLGIAPRHPLRLYSWAT